MIIIAGVVAVVVLLALFVIATFNKLARRRNQVSNAWAQIDVQLKRRYDLIPNVVESVKGYASHEKTVFENITSARANAINASGPADQAQADNILTGALKSMFAVAEAYPDLKANTAFLQLQQELEDSENKVAYARQYYNDAVLGMNNAVATFPSNLVAGMLGFHRAEPFQAPGDERAAVHVQF